MGVNSLPKTVTRQRRDCDLNQGLSPVRQPLGYRATTKYKFQIFKFPGTDSRSQSMSVSVGT